MIEARWQTMRKLLLVRLDNLGDVLLMTPALHSLKTALPLARLNVLASPVGTQVVRLVPTNNIGPMQIAAALKTPVIALFALTNPPAQGGHGALHIASCTLTCHADSATAVFAHTSISVHASCLHSMLMENASAFLVAANAGAHEIAHGGGL